MKNSDMSSIQKAGICSGTLAAESVQKRHSDSLTNLDSNDFDHIMSSCILKGHTH